MPEPAFYLKYTKTCAYFLLPHQKSYFHLVKGKFDDINIRLVKKYILWLSVLQYDVPYDFMRHGTYFPEIRTIIKPYQNSQKYF